jgi:hypothetical protein
MTSRDDLRIGDAERDEVMTALREHFAQGRLTHAELDERLDGTLAARTAGDLRRVIADLPVPPAPRPVEYDHRWAGGWAPPPRADLGTWGHYMADARRERFQRRRRGHGGPPVFPLLLLMVLAACLVSGSLWPLFGAMKMLFIAWIVLAVLMGLLRHRHHQPRVRRRL